VSQSKVAGRLRTPLIGARGMMGVGLALAAGVIWSFGAVLVRGSTELDTWQYLGWRSVGLIGMLWLLGAARGVSLPRATLAQPPIAWIASVGLVFSSVLIILALKSTTVANATFLASTAPVIALVLALLVFADRPTRGIVVSALAALAGVGVMVVGEAGRGSLVGNLAAVGSAMGFAVYSLCLRAQPGKDWTTALWAHGWICLAVCVLVAILGGSGMRLGWQLLLPIFHGGVIIGCGLLLFNRASGMVSAVNLTVIAQMETVLAPLWGWVFLDELPPLTTILGGAIILVGVVGAGLAMVRSRGGVPPVVAA
jgi:drug/metabolite transporter (DMT)-like permease